MLIIQDISFALPATAGKIVSMCPYRDRVLVACEWGLYELTEDGVGGYSMREQLISRINELEKRGE